LWLTNYILGLDYVYRKEMQRRNANGY